MLRFDKNRKRVQKCPCGKSNKDGKFISYQGFDDKGYCHSCGKTFYPGDKRIIQRPNTPFKKKPNSTLSQETLWPYWNNPVSESPFGRFLVNHFGTPQAKSVIDRYKLGVTAQKRMVFPLIDDRGDIMSAKIMRYELLNAPYSFSGYDIKRGKNSGDINWLHSTLRLKDFVLDQCLFGMHLIKGVEKRTVAIVESEKTAIIASMYLPQYVWLATGSKSNLSKYKLAPLLGRKIILFPDVNATDEWTSKKGELKQFSDLHVSYYLDKLAKEAEKAEGLDLADYLIRHTPGASSL